MSEEIKNKIKSKRGATIKPSNLAKILSLEKALSVSKNQKYYNFNVIGCDTLIHLDNKIFDKAKSIKEAKLKIKLLSGKTHKIVSGLTICKRGVKIWQCSTTTNVKIKKLMEGVGFVKEGVVRKIMETNNQYKDAAIYGMLKEECRWINN